MKPLYFKSFRENGTGSLELVTPDGSGGVMVSQALEDVLQEGVLRPNSDHSQLSRRLSTSRVSWGYPGVYRQNGLLFTTETEPDYHVPFDLIALTKQEAFDSGYHESEFLPGCQKFVFDEYSSMMARFPSSQEAVKELNGFREKSGLPAIPSEEMKYNECCFTKPIDIKPVALVGCSDHIKDLGKDFGIVNYPSMPSYVYANSPFGDLGGYLGLGPDGLIENERKNEED